MNMGMIRLSQLELFNAKGNTVEENIPFFAALASPIRIKILERLAKSDANIKELAEDVGVTSAMMTSHIRKLEEVGLVPHPALRKTVRSVP